MSFKGEKSNSSRIAMVNQNPNQEVAPDQNLVQDQGPDLDQNAGPSQGVKVGPDLDQTPGRDVEQNQEADHLRTSPGPDHLKTNLDQGLLEENPNLDHPRTK